MQIDANWQNSKNKLIWPSLQFVGVDEEVQACLMDPSVWATGLCDSHVILVIF